MAGTAQPSNNDILGAISGVEKQEDPTVQSTGINTNSFSTIPGQQSALGGGIGGTNPLDSNANYMGTIQGIMGGGQQAFNPYTLRAPGTPPTHSIGGDSWSSQMSLDPQAIMNNLGLGGG